MEKIRLSSLVIDTFNKRFSLKKAESLANLSAIDIPPILKQSVKEQKEIIKKIRNKDLLIFYNTIIDCLKNYEFPYMYENLKTLKMYPIYINSPKFMKRKVAAYYSCIKNIIKYTKGLKDKVLPHELLHMSSTVKRDEDESIFSGFSQSTKLGKYELIGRGINEGYTQLLTERYFNIGYKSYSLEVFIASKLENIVGKRKMEVMYFDADLKELVNQLLKYSDEKSIIKFLYAVDTFGTLYTQTNIIQDFSWIKKAYYYVVNFLVNMKVKKIMETENSFRLAKKELSEYMKNFEYKIVNKKENKEIALLEDFVMEKIIENNMNKLDDFYIFNKVKHI